MYITIDNKKHEQLKLISRLTAQQLFYQHDYIALAQAVQLNENTEPFMKKINENFQDFMMTNNTLVKLLIETKVLEKPEEQVVTEEEPIKPQPPRKPTFTIVKE
jgi:hypothetical protein